ncbi:MAG: sulfotransferase [Cyanobacteria bacterium]|jgi:hypothetical protein|nr:sulfotransferase [Cyanobacteria bacterium GSL.Bin21]
MFKAPLFFLASPRSYTSLTCAMMGQHPEAYGFPELNLLVDDTLAGMIKKFKGKSKFQMHGLLRTVAQLYSGEQTLYSVEMAQRWINRRLDRSTKEIYIELCEKIYPLRGVDKSPAYSSDSRSLYRILKAFPNGYFIHLVRHPRAQGNSVMKAGNEGRFAKMIKAYDYSVYPPVIDPQFKWLQVQNRIREFFKDIPEQQKLVIRGEDLLSEPKIYFGKIAQWLGMNWDDNAFEAITHPQDSPFAGLGPAGATLGNDGNFLRSTGYKKRPIPASSLDGPLSWRNDGKGFIPEVIQLAHEFGYD